MLKKVALTLPPIRRVHTDLENRRRRVIELEGHLRVMKKQMARVLSTKNSAKLSESALVSDAKYIKSERDKLSEQYKDLEVKYDALYKDFCILSMSNEALLKTNESLLNGEFSTAGPQKTNVAKPARTSAVKKTVKTRKATPTPRKTRTSVKSRQK